MAGVANGWPTHDQMKPVSIQEVTYSRIRDLTSGDRDVPRGDRLVAADGNNFHNLVLTC